MNALDEIKSRAPTGVIKDFLQRSISLSEIGRKIWKGRLILVLATLSGLLWGGYQAHRAGPQFVATMSMLPSQTDNDSGGAVGGAFGALASFAGGDSTGQVPKFAQFLTALGSVGVATVLQEKYDLLCKIYKGECDPRTHVWKERAGLFPATEALFARIGGLPDPNAARTGVDLADYNKNAIVVFKDKQSGLVTLSYQNGDPKFAAYYLRTVVQTANDYIRNQDRSVQRAYVEYVSNRAASNTNVQQRETLANLLLQQERKLMMTEVDVPYAASTLDGPTVTPINSVLKSILLSGFLGLIIGASIVLIYPQLRFRFGKKQ